LNVVHSHTAFESLRPHRRKREREFSFQINDSFPPVLLFDRGGMRRDREHCSNVIHCHIAFESLRPHRRKGEREKTKV
jgi:hypothetical protein